MGFSATFGQREQVRTTPEPLPRPVKKLELLLGRQGIQIDLAVCHGPFSLAPKGRVQCRANRVELRSSIACAGFVSFRYPLLGRIRLESVHSRRAGRAGRPMFR